ncbi:unnamed protein product [Lactuca virosa]|uniref:Uncharacterized protein n=1 Tax=Lactuca virosa TaxID=75947 RepID=A0AAU9MY77_9ASTR|nr:unnamed protein product [Lactuca virosa]
MQIHEDLGTLMKKLKDLGFNETEKVKDESDEDEVEIRLILIVWKLGLGSLITSSSRSEYGSIVGFLTRFQGPICSLQSLGLELFIVRYYILAVKSSLGQNIISRFQVWDLLFLHWILDDIDVKAIRGKDTYRVLLGKTKEIDMQQMLIMSNERE